MKYYDSFKRKDGSYRTIEFSAQEMADANFVALIFMISVCVLFSTFAAGILILLTLYQFEESNAKPSIWGGLISFYFLFDMGKQWVIWFFLNLIYGNDAEGKYWVKMFTDLNIGYFVTCVFLVFLGSTVFYNSKDNATGKTQLVIATLAVFLITFFIARLN